MIAPLEWHAPSHECTRLLIQLVPCVGRPAEPDLLAALPGPAFARDIGGGDQQHGAAVGGDAGERAVAFVGDMDDAAGPSLLGAGPRGEQPDLLRPHRQPALATVAWQAVGDADEAGHEARARPLVDL